MNIRPGITSGAVFYLSQPWDQHVIHRLHRVLHRTYPHYPQVSPQGKCVKTQQNQGFFVEERKKFHSSAQNCGIFLVNNRKSQY
jgi:hypothetical protein